MNLECFAGVHWKKSSENSHMDSTLDAGCPEIIIFEPFVWVLVQARLGYTMGWSTLYDIRP